MTLLLGAVAYDPKVVTIWDGFRVWLRERDLDFDYVLFSNYERQVEELIDGRVGVAWNSPLAWVRARRLAAARSVELTAVTMRDTDCDLTSVIVTRGDSGLKSLDDLRGRTVATGAIDSPQATLIPLQMLRRSDLEPGKDLMLQRFDVGVGLHGDHIGGERDAARALASGQVDAACMIDANLLLFGQEGILAPDVHVLARTGAYDHCTMTAGPGARQDELARLGELLLGMSYADPQMRVLLDLEGLKQWVPPRLHGFAQLEEAVDATGFYDQAGEIGAGDYRP